jgi:hemerythrin
MRLEWSDLLYSTGFKEIDDQHKELFNQVNLLLDATLANRRMEEIIPMLDFLEEYTRNHFRFEEELMAKQSCSAAAVNADEHERFMDDLVALRKRIGHQGTSESVGVLLTAKVVCWLQSHVGEIDIRLREGLSKNDFYLKP